MGYQFDSSMCHIKNAIGEEGNMKPPQKFHFPIKLRALSLVSATLETEYAMQFILKFKWLIKSSVTIQSIVGLQPEQDSNHCFGEA